MRNHREGVWSGIDIKEERLEMKVVFVFGQVTG